MSITAVDVGFGATKAMDNAGNKICLPSEFCIYDHTSEEVKGAQKFKLEGRDYLVGNEVAKRRQRIEKFGNVDRLIRFSPLLIMAAEKKVPVNGFLAVGLPLLNMNRKNDLKKRLKEFYSSEVIVIPQGYGVFEDVGLQNVIILDIGFNTLDVYVSEGGRVVRDECISIHGQGMENVIEPLQRHIIRKHNLPATTKHQVEMAVRGDNKIYKDGKLLDIRNDADTILAAWSGELVSNLRSGSWGRRLNMVEKVVIAGGGAYWFQLDNPKEFGDRLMQLKDPEFSNVRGFLKVAAKYIEKNSEKKGV